MGIPCEPERCDQRGPSVLDSHTATGLVQDPVDDHGQVQVEALPLVSEMVKVCPLAVSLALQ